MPRVFSYGSLQKSEVQLATFGVLLPGVAAEIVGFELVHLHRDGKQLANVVRSHSQTNRVGGTVFEFTVAQLALADEYERPDNYARIEAPLAAGGVAWVYVDAL
ncbi:MAG: gamma-glutamylcyclotransferase family protein [Pseudomonadota bacterium]